MLLVFGSINVDLVFRVAALPRPGDTVLAPDYATVPGGKGANQAVAAARDGAAGVRMIGRVGRDAFGRLALDSMNGAGVDTTAVAADDAPTGCAAIGVDGTGENQIIVASGANARVAADQVDAAWLGRETTVVLQMEVPADANTDLIRRARGRQARIVLNLAPAAGLADDVLRAVDVLVVNGGEAAGLAASLGLVGEGAALAAALAARLGIAVVVTLGGNGAIAATRDGMWMVDALPVAQVDTTAAGDAFVGVLAASLDRGAALAQALHRASVAAGLACLTEGAQPSLPTRDAIDAALPRLAPARLARS